MRSEDGKLFANKLGTLSLLLALAVACRAEAATAQAGGAVSAADRTTILRAQNLTADASGKVENECGENVTPQFLPAELGGSVGRAVLLVMAGGPNAATCYGDGPGLSLMKREGAAWRMIYSSRGGYLAILPTEHGGVRDLAFAGPGFEHPLWTWNGREYAHAGRSVGDAETAKAIVLP
jgi:hypothetical protein